MSKSGKIDLSIIILNFNTKELLQDCLLSLKKVEKKANFEVIVSDNGSEDGSVEMIKKDFPQVVLVENKKNLGFAAGNNAAKSAAKGEFVLFLNSDTVVPEGTIGKSLEYIKEDLSVGAVSCKTVLPSGELDRDARRSFPTPWVAFTHFSHLDRIFPKSHIFSKYWYGYIPANVTHDIDVLQGAFCLTRKKILDDIGWFDEDYFLDGEDVDLCWRIKEKGFRIVYYPDVSILHVKKGTKKKVKSRKNVAAGVDAMEIFYRKRLWSRYPLIINLKMIAFIKFMKVIRIIRSYI
ncbi:MAG TPA: glycosyltransferase family 2 protein [Patescibacteria group bacterium]